jgi:diguanylate cyclase (GGDEF)-like protein
VSATIRASLRTSDLFGRLGGEEFGLLFHETDADTAERCAERVRQAIEGWSEPGLPQVTVSIGLAAVHQSEDLELALAKADAALYAAKRGGRNRCLLVGRETERIAA